MRAAVARHPDDVTIDATVHVATPLVFGREGVQVGQQAHGREAYCIVAASAKERGKATISEPAAPS
jgi:hypothetical protein